MIICNKGDKMRREIVIGFNEKDQRLDKFLRKLFKDVELSVIFCDLRKGNIKVNGKKEKNSYRLKENDVIRIFGYHYDFDKIELKNQSILEESKYIKPKICFEDNNILVAIKEVGTVVHSNGDDMIDNLTDNVRIYLYKKGDYVVKENLTFSPSPVNRLDRNTYGLVIFGKNSSSLKELNYAVRERKVLKYYRALVEGRIKDGLYKSYIKKDPKLNKSIVSNKNDGTFKEIQMRIKTIDTSGIVSLLDIELITGRSHQIRSHLKFLRNPIIGDMKYGNKELRSYFFNKYGIDNQLLFAYKLVFNGINDDMQINYLNNKVIVMPFPNVFKRIMRQEFKLTI